MKDLPYFRWYPADAGMDEGFRTMSFEERGFFHHCLDIAWINDGIPLDPALRAKVLGVQRQMCDRLWTPLVSLRFTPHSARGGYLVCPRQERERAHAKVKSVKASESAKVGSERRANAQHAHVRADSDSDSDSAFIQIKTSLQVENFAMFLEVCATAEMQGSETDIKAARSEWDRLDLAQRLAACQGIKDRVAAGELADPGFRPLPQNYLKNRTWQRTIREKREPVVDKQHAHRNEVAGLMKIIGGLRS